LYHDIVPADPKVERTLKHLDRQGAYRVANDGDEGSDEENAELSPARRGKRVIVRIRVILIHITTSH